MNARVSLFTHVNIQVAIQKSRNQQQLNIKSCVKITDRLYPSILVKIVYNIWYTDANAGQWKLRGLPAIGTRQLRNHDSGSRPQLISGQRAFHVFQETSSFPALLGSFQLYKRLRKQTRGILSIKKPAKFMLISRAKRSVQICRQVCLNIQERLLC